MLDLFKEIGKLACKPTDTPIEPNHKIGDNNSNASVDRGNYQRLVGWLIYLSHMRLNFAYAICVVSQFMHNPKEAHHQVIHQILHYQKGAPRKGIPFKKGTSLTLDAYIDIDYVGSVVNICLTSCYCTFLVKTK